MRTILVGTGHPHNCPTETGDTAVSDTSKVSSVGNEKEIRVDGLVVKAFDMDELKEGEKHERKKNLLTNGILPFLMFGVRPPGGPGV